MKPEVCALVVNWNSADLTEACVAAIQNGSFVPDIVVVDNGSDDDSWSKLRTIRNVRLVQMSTNNGFGSGCNRGLRLAIERAYQFVWILNPDTLVGTTTLEEMLHTAMADPFIGAVGSRMAGMGPEATHSWGAGRISWLLGSSKAIHKGSDQIDYICGACALVRTAAVEQVGLFDERFVMYWEDADLGVRLKRDGWQLAMSEHSLVKHVHEGSWGEAGRLRAVQAYNRSAIYFFYKHLTRPSAPTLVGCLLRAGAQLLRGRGKGAWAVVMGAMQGSLACGRRGVD